MLTKELKDKFESIIEIHNLDLAIVDILAKKDANILRPIKGAAFEIYFQKILKIKFPNLESIARCLTGFFKLFFIAKNLTYFK